MNSIAVAPDGDQGQKKRVNDIFQNIFQEIFLSNCGNPIDLEQTKQAFQKHMGGSLTLDQMEEMEKLFIAADLTNVSKQKHVEVLKCVCYFLKNRTLTKEEVRTFIHRALKEGIFTDFLMQQEQKEQAAVDALYEEIFLDAFISQENDLMDKSKYCRVVKNKLQDDQQLKSLLIN